MSQSSLGLSARSFVIAGMSAAVVGAAVVTPASVPAASSAKISAALTLTSVTTSLEDGIKNIYDAVEPWAAWGAELAQWGLGYVPGLWWVAPGIDLAYFSIEPLVQAGVYTFADVVGLDFAQIWPDISTGITTAGQNFVNYGLAWLQSLVPFPPLPPFPPRPFAAGAESALPAAAADLLVSPHASSITTPIENAIKNTYKFVEGWTNYAMQWADYVLGLIPVVNWFSPVVPLVYNTIEPLVRGGVFATADLIGLNFAAIGPDIRNAIRTSIDNAVSGVLNWINIPLPPRPPVRSAATAGAASIRAAAAVTAEVPEAVAGITAPEAVAETAPETVAKTGDAPTADAPEAVTSVTTEAPAQAGPTQQTRAAHRRHIAAAAGSGTVKAERPARAPRSDRG